MLLGIMLAPHP